ncbi:MAG: GntR family transcriptional regulator [Eubacteriales bacterium]
MSEEKLEYDSFIEAQSSLPLRDVVFQELRKEILTGVLKPGERLMEIHLAKRLGVSRTPIREAIRKLELEGLAKMIHRKGAVVSEITEKHLRDVLEVRKTLDVLGIELACDRIEQEELEQLEQACKDFETAIEFGSVREIAAADVRLHDIILRATRNERLIQLISNLAEQMYRYRFEYIKDKSIHEQLIEEHKIMYESILKGDKVNAGKAVRLHIDNQEKAILQLIAEKSE